MGPKIINLGDKRMEQTVVAISAMVANAVDMVQKAREIIDNSESMLLKAQMELEELYIALDRRTGDDDSIDD